MSFLRNPHLDLTNSRIETERCVLVPFSLDGRVDIRELQEEYCRANKTFLVRNTLTYEQELEFVRLSEENITRGEEFQNFILEKSTNTFLGVVRLRPLESGEVNIGIWIRESEQGKGYASEAYDALIQWTKENIIQEYLVHSLNPENIGSRRLAEKFGGILQSEKTDRGHEVYHIPL